MGFMSRRALLASAVGLPAVLALGSAAVAAAQAPSRRYTMTAFTNDSETDLYVYESNDAMTFDLVKAQAYTPPSGLMRDPCMFRHTDGVYYLAYTTAWDGHTIGFARSTDRVTWAHLYDYEFTLPGVTSAWAPEWLIDGDGRIHVMVSLSDGYRFTPNLMTTTDPSSPTAWTEPTPMIGLCPEPGDDASYGYIDTTVARIGTRYYAFTKNETTKLIELATADSPVGPYTFVAKDDWAGWGSPREGQSVTRLPNGGWRMFFDSYIDETYLYSDSYDNFQTWSKPREVPGLSGFIRHVTVLSEASPGVAPAP
ncbi:glycoside hydrolase [Nocardia sp. NPDC005978]|uniref:glycoside hydrolase n=1 Tax=unclassified Nocardia TaxID=2637762 RepID=UPI0033B0D228